MMPQLTAIVDGNDDYSVAEKGPRNTTTSTLNDSINLPNNVTSEDDCYYNIQLL